MNLVSKTNVLTLMSRLSGTEENAPVELKEFLFLPDYKRLQEDKCFLILGERGAGKTCLFNTLNDLDGFRLIMKDSNNLFSSLNNNAKSIRGYDNGDHGIPFPTPEIFKLPLFDDEKSITTYWAGSLLIVLKNALKQDAEFANMFRKYVTEEIYQLLTIDNLLVPTKWVDLLNSSPELWEKTLYHTDIYLEQLSQTIYITYDYLDRVSTKYNRLFPFIRSLLSFWYTRNSRWKRIHCKIFLRTDLFDNSLMLQFPDASKLKNNSMILSWKPLTLYQLLVKRLANCDSSDVLEYLKQTPDLILNKNEIAGYLPTKSRDVMYNFIRRLIGEYMGATPKKGLSYQWIPNHLQDAHGVLAPRSFLNCFREAARYMLEHPEEIGSLAENRLLLPTSVQKALIKVSQSRVRELIEEYSWLEELQKAFSGLTMLMDKNEFISHIDMSVWNEHKKASLPEQSAYGIFSVLEKLGIVMVTSDNRVNVPEIYLHGFNMKRKGGLKRPRDIEND